MKTSLRARFLEHGFVNTYMFCDHLDYHFKPLYLLFRPKQFDMEFYKFVLGMERNQNFVETIDIDGGIIMVYRIPKKFGRDYQLFLKGRYSEMSPEFKSCFLMKQYCKNDKTGELLVDNNGKYITEYTMFYHIFNKTEKLKGMWREALGDDIPDDMDLYDRYSQEKETLVYE